MRELPGERRAQTVFAALGVLAAPLPLTATTSALARQLVPTDTRHRHRDRLHPAQGRERLRPGHGMRRQLDGRRSHLPGRPACAQRPAA
jgi:hypothetical protein